MMADKQTDKLAADILLLISVYPSISKQDLQAVRQTLSKYLPRGRRSQPPQAEAQIIPFHQKRGERERT